MITRPVCNAILKLKTASVGAMNDVTYKALFTGIVIGLTFSLVTFMLGYYVIPK